MKSKINKESFKQIHQTLMVVNLKSTKGKKNRRWTPSPPKDLAHLNNLFSFTILKIKKSHVLNMVIIFKDRWFVLSTWTKGMFTTATSTYAIYVPSVHVPIVHVLGTHCWSSVFSLSSLHWLVVWVLAGDTYNKHIHTHIHFVSSHVTAIEKL